MFTPSNATPTGLGPAGNSVGTVLALYHFSSATFSGFDNGGAPFPACCSGELAAGVCPAMKLAAAKTANIIDIPMTIGFINLVPPESWALQLADLVDAVTRHPNVCPVEGQTGGVGEGPSARHKAVSGAQLEDRNGTRHPNVLSIERHPVRLQPDRECAQDATVAGPQLGNCSSPSVCNPHIGPVKADPERLTSGEGTQHRAIAGAKFHHGVAARVRHPDVFTVKSDRGGRVPYGKVAQIPAVAGPQLRDPPVAAGV